MNITNLDESMNNDNLNKIMDACVNINDFIEIKTVNDDNDIITLEYFYKNKYVCMIDYNIDSGQINFLFVFDCKYRNHGLGTQMLLKAISDTRENGIKKIWSISSNNLFWSNVLNKTFKKQINSTNDLNNSQSSLYELSGISLIFNKYIH